jgi:hypothetical protein
MASGAWVAIRDAAEIVAEQLGATVHVGRERGYASLVEPCHLLAGRNPVIDLPDGIQLVTEQMRKYGWL